MKSLYYIITIIIASYLGGLVLPWWGFAVVSLFLAYIFNLKSSTTFLLTVLSIFLLWLSLMLMKDAANDGILSAQISSLFKDLPIIGIAVISSLYAGIIGGLSALIGKYLRDLF